MQRSIGRRRGNGLKRLFCLNWPVTIEGKMTMLTKAVEWLDSEGQRIRERFSTYAACREHKEYLERAGYEVIYWSQRRYNRRLWG